VKEHFKISFTSYIEINPLICYPYLSRIAISISRKEEKCRHWRYPAVIMGAGRAHPLPAYQAARKPAVPFGGKYRLIDVPSATVSIRAVIKDRCFDPVNSVSLHRHISNTYNF
jgi:hypothetical protein